MGQTTSNINLRVGDRLTKPLRDEKGTLLLRSGVLITERVLEKLKTLSANYADNNFDREREKPEIGPLLSSVAPRHGTQPYDEHKRSQLQERFKSAGKVVREVFASFSQGSLRNTQPIEELASQYIDEMLGDTDQVIESSVNFGDHQLTSRCVKLGVMSMAIGMEFGLQRPELEEIGLAGLIHDWGMFELPPDSRSLHPEMTRDARVRYLRHPNMATELLEQLENVPQSVFHAVSQVHERLDGSGFPNHIAAPYIHLHARIIGLADQYIALVSPLNGATPIVPCDAVAYLLNQVGKRRLDARVARAFLQVITQFPIGSTLQLSDKRKVKVLRSNGPSFGFPVVEDVDSGEIIDLSAESVFVTRPLLRQETHERRLRRTYRRLMSGNDLPEFVDHDCFENADLQVATSSF